MIFFISLGILVLVLGAQIYLRSFDVKLEEEQSEIFYSREKFDIGREEEKTEIFFSREVIEKFLSERFSKYLFIFSVIVIFGFLIYQSYLQYEIWSKIQLTRFLLPPYDKTYFFIYAISHFFAPYLASLVAAIFFLVVAKFFNRKYGGRFFYPEEPYWASLGIFLTGHPGWLFYLILLIVSYLVVHFVSQIFAKSSNERISLYYLWIPTALFVIIIINIFLAKLPIWPKLII